MSSARTRDLVARDLAHVWHPFTQQQSWGEDDPLVVDRAEGMHFWDTDGRRYLDGVASLWVNVHGHRVPEMDDAIRAQLDRLDHTTYLGLTHEPGIVLAEKLLATAPAGLTPGVLRRRRRLGGRGRDQDGLPGAGPARRSPGRLYVHVAEGYHGDTLGAVSVGGIDLFHATYRPILLETRMVASPGVLGRRASRGPSAPRWCSPSCGRCSSATGDQVCAVVVEPMVQAAGGMLTHDASFLRGCRALADEFGALLVADEVATGIGRTGRMWAVEHAGVTPDLLTCGKGLTAGYLPLSAVLATEEVYEAFLGSPASGRTFFHGHSYTANPLCCAAAIANLDLMARAGHRRARGRGRRPDRRVDGAAGRRRPGRRGPPDRHDDRDRGRGRSGERTGFAVCQEARRNGVWVRPLGDVVVLMPPLAIGDDDLRTLVDTVDRGDPRRSSGERLRLAGRPRGRARRGRAAPAPGAARRRATTA